MKLEPVIDKLQRFGPLTASCGASVMGIACWAGAFSPALDGLNHFAPFWLLFSLGAIAACLFFRRADRIAIGLASLGALLQLGIIAPEFVRSSAPRASIDAAAPQVRIVWLNTWLGNRPSGDVLEYLEQTDADFLLVSELHDEGQAGFRRLRELYPTLIACVGGHECNTRIYARREAITIETPGDLRAVSGTFDIDGAPLRLVAAHMPRPNPPGRQQRALSDLVRVVQSDGAENVILAGDFNSTPWSFTLRNFDAASGLDRHTRALPTWPAQAWTRLRLPALFAFLPIDHVYSGERWRLVDLRRGRRTSSDHYPIEATFQYVPAS